MKTCFRILALAIMIGGLATSGLAQSKNKFGHINSNELLAAMPARDTAELTLKEYANQLQSQMGIMQQEYEQKVQDFTQNRANMTDLILETKTREIQELESRIADFQGTAQESLQKKEAELLEPIVEQARQAIQDVAKENGYTYVFDSGVGVLLYQPESDDILPLVKTKLGL